MIYRVREKIQTERDRDKYRQEERGTEIKRKELLLNVLFNFYIYVLISIDILSKLLSLVPIFEMFFCNVLVKIGVFFLE